MMLIVSVSFSLSDTKMDFGHSSVILSIESLTVFKALREPPVVSLTLSNEFCVVGNSTSED